MVLKKLFRSDLPLYPFLLVIYPILYLWNANRGQQPAYVLLPILGAALLTAVVLNILALAFTRSSHRAALLVAVLAFYILTFGHLNNLMNLWNQGHLLPYVLPISAIVVLVGLAWIAIRRLGGPNLTKIMNLVTAVLVLFQVASTLPYFLRSSRLGPTPAQAQALPNSIPVSGHQPSPQRDVYFILVDNYGREDILLEEAGFDNSQMVTALQERGFIFPNCAQGNYFWTAPAMSSILNMEYLDQLGVEEASYNRRGHYDDLAPLIQESLVIQKFRAYGYHVVTFRGFMGMIDIQDTDTYISFEHDPDYNRQLAVARFRDLFYQTTLFSPIANTYDIEITQTPIEQEPVFDDHLAEGSEDLSSEVLDPKFDEVFRQNHFAFEALTRIPNEIEGPKFVYAHIYSAHWPFMTRPDGSLRLPFTQSITDAGYRDAIRFTNDQLLTAIDSILANSEVEPIIILQGDHSNESDEAMEWSGQDRLKILSAYYLPAEGDQLLYDTISPVNNFRLVFQQYFGENMPLLPDVHHILNPITRRVNVTPATCIHQVFIDEVIKE